MNPPVHLFQVKIVPFAFAILGIITVPEGSPQHLQQLYEQSCARVCEVRGGVETAKWDTEWTSVCVCKDGTKVDPLDHGRP